MLKTQSHTKLTLKIFWQHAMKYKVQFYLIILSVLLTNGFRMLVPIYYKRLFDGAVDGVATDILFGVLLFVLFIEICKIISSRFGFLLSSYFHTRVMRDLSNTCFEYLHRNSTAFFNDNFVGSLTKRVNRFYRAFETIFDRVQWDLIPTVVVVIVSIIVFGTRSLTLSFILTGWLIIYCMMNFIFTKYKMKFDFERSKQDSKVTGILADTITNNQNVKLLNGFEREKAYYSEESTRLSDIRRYAWDIATLFEGVQIFLMVVLELSIIWLAIRLYRAGGATIGDVFMVQIYLGLIFSKLWDFGRIIRDVYEQMAEAEEMTEILDTPHEIEDKKNAKILIVKRGEILFENVKFNYHKTRNILPKLSFKIRAGERVALVGASGAGKSTIVKLLLRNSDVTKGKILIDNQNIAVVTQESLWRAISLVPQDPVLFHRTLMENIRYGRPEATDEEVIEASKSAHCHEFISSFPDGYATFVGERGMKLSGGERQRVAIARAILRNAPILILDEATSSLDSESEHLIQRALFVLMKDKTVIVVAHRLSTIMMMDRIIVLDNGIIQEEGTHNELLFKNGQYAKFWNIQAGGFVA